VTFATLLEFFILIVYQMLQEQINACERCRRHNAKRNVPL